MDYAAVDPPSPSAHGPLSKWPRRLLGADGHGDRFWKAPVLVFSRLIGCCPVQKRINVERYAREKSHPSSEPWISMRARLFLGQFVRGVGPKFPLLWDAMTTVINSCCAAASLQCCNL